MSTKPSTEQLQQSIHVICKVIGQIPCFHLFEYFVARRFAATESETALRAMIHNAALDSSLISLRCFNEFFGSRRQKDDIRADDFSGVVMEPFLPADDATAINKYLAHITVVRSDIVTKPWFLDDLVLLGLHQGIAFLSTLEKNFPPLTEAGSIELSGVRDAARLVIGKISKLHEPNAT
jgi:hypothetical protein